MKHITIDRPQMVSITKLYLTLRKKPLFVSVVLPIEKARSHRMTLGITEVILTGFTSSTLHSTAALKHRIRNPESGIRNRKRKQKRKRKTESNINNRKLKNFALDNLVLSKENLS